VKRELAIKSPVRFRAVAAGICFASALVTGAVLAQQPSHDTFNPHDTRVFKSVACTKDHRPIEALYYIVASRSDMTSSNSSPSSQLMNEEVDKSWQNIASRLTGEQVTEERFVTTYHSLLSEHILRLQRAVQENSGVSIAVTEVNSRLMDPTKDKGVPSCNPQ